MKTLYPLIISALALTTAACSSTPLTEQEQFEKEDREILRQEEFDRFVAACIAAHGRIHISGTGSSSRQQTASGIPMPGPGESYTCETRPIY